MSCTGCGEPVAGRFCSSCGRRAVPTGELPRPDERHPQYRVVYGHATSRTWGLLVSALFMLAGGIGMVLLALRA